MPPDSPQPDDSPSKRPVSLRLSPELYEQLAAAAQAQGRSLTGEAELRLSQSFARQALAPEILLALFGAGVAGFVLLCGRAMRVAGQMRWVRDHAAAPWDGDAWWRDPASYESACDAVRWLLDEFRPDETQPHPVSRHVLGEQVASARLVELLADYGPVGGIERLWGDAAMLQLFSDFALQSRWRRTSEARDALPPAQAVEPPAAGADGPAGDRRPGQSER